MAELALGSSFLSGEGDADPGSMDAQEVTRFGIHPVSRTEPVSRVLRLRIRRRGGLGLGFMRHLAVNVGPEFLHNDRHRVIAELGRPDAGGVLQSPVRGNEHLRIRRRAHVPALGMVPIRRDGSR